MSINMGIISSNGLNSSFSTHPSSPNSTPSPTSIDDVLLKKDLDDESEPTSPNGDTPKKAGRRKIKIEFIDDKSRRHITFSKRKAGIMKKAYELSTLTGTQVLLLVASETGHVYTFATSKLQPLITRPEGKNLIQSCLNTPDVPTSPPLNNSNSNSSNNSGGARNQSPSTSSSPNTLVAMQHHHQQQQHHQQQHQQQQQLLQQQAYDSMMIGGYAGADAMYSASDIADKELERRMMGKATPDNAKYMQGNPSQQPEHLALGYSYQSSHLVNTYYPSINSGGGTRGYLGSASSSPTSPNQYTSYPPSSLLQGYPSQ